MKKVAQAQAVPVKTTNLLYETYNVRLAKGSPSGEDKVKC